MLVFGGIPAALSILPWPIRLMDEILAHFNAEQLEKKP
jgi:hypothetical protein